jgi:histidinol phosphatase-like enzyme
MSKDSIIKKTLIIIRGLPGAGKTTLAKMLTGFNVAADDMPGLYVDGKYQIELQARSHEWCREQVESWLSQDMSLVAVHNTFVSFEYTKPYVELAEKWGYAVQIIHCEGVKLDGNYTKSIHDLPPALFESMRDRWEQLRPSQKRALTIEYLGKQFRELVAPDLIVFDMDGTIKIPKDGRKFPQSPDDFELTSYIQDFNSNLFDCHFVLVTNQRGIETGAKTLEFLNEEISLLENECCEKLDLDFERVYCATARNSKKMMITGDSIFGEYEASVNADKPNTGMMLEILKDEMSDLDSSNIWIVGDAHTTSHGDDWEFYCNCRDSIEGASFVYIPIEMLAVAQELI